jgi:hypothetical protein
MDSDLRSIDVVLKNTFRVFFLKTSTVWFAVWVIPNCQAVLMKESSLHGNTKFHKIFGIL